MRLCFVELWIICWVFSRARAFCERTKWSCQTLCLKLCESCVFQWHCSTFCSFCFVCSCWVIHFKTPKPGFERNPQFRNCISWNICTYLLDIYYLTVVLLIQCAGERFVGDFIWRCWQRSTTMSFSVIVTRRFAVYRSLSWVTLQCRSRQRLVELSWRQLITTEWTLTVADRCMILNCCTIWC